MNPPDEVDVMREYRDRLFGAHLSPAECAVWDRAFAEGVRFERAQVRVLLTRIGGFLAVPRRGEFRRGEFDELAAEVRSLMEDS